MKNNGWFSRLLNQHPGAVRMSRAAGALAAAVVIAAASPALAQDQNPAAPAPEPRITVPEGYTLHHTIDAGGRMSNQVGSGPMYDTLVNLQSGPRILGESFELNAIPGAGGITLVDHLSAFSSGYGGDPYSFTKLDMNKGNAYEFSGLFRRDRQYMDFNTLGNPNIPGGQSIPVSGSTTPYAWQQFGSSPFLFNTVRRMTDASLTVLPLSTFTYRFEYSQNIFQGPSLTPSGNAIAGQEIILQEFQRSSTDDFTAAIDWKPVRDTKLTFEEQIDHYKNDSYFNLAPQFLTVQESNGISAQLLTSYQNFMPYGYNGAGNFVPYAAPSVKGAGAASGVCSSSIANPSQILYASSNGGRPTIDPACNVITSYSRLAPTRVIFPTEMFRLQSSSIKNISMNGDVRYTNANMNMPSYYDSFQGLQGVNRQITWLGYANAKRQVMAVDYGIVWQMAPRVSLEEQVNYSNIRQPGLAGMISQTLVTVPATADTINSTQNAPTAGTASITGGPQVGGTQAGYWGQRFATNNLTLSWDATPRTTLSLTWRYQNYLISESQGNQAHNIPIPLGNTTSGQVTINENGGIINAAMHPTNNWDLSASFEAAYNDNVFTPMGFRQLQHYRVHTIYRVAPWATVTGAFNDIERHNNTNNNAADVALYASSGGKSGEAYFGPLDHVDHVRMVSFGTEMFPNDRYGLDLDYTFSGVYTSENICFQGVAYLLPGGAVAPGVATQSGVLCGGVTPGHGANNVLYLDRQFMNAPTQFGSVALALSPSPKFRYNLGYRVSAVSGSRSFSDARDVNASLVSTYQTPFVSAAWTVHPGFIWKGEYDYFGYGEGGPSGAKYCNANAALAVGTPSAPGVLCSSVPYTAINGPAYGATLPRNFHANNVTLGFHYEF
jgi:hypothetical protein